MPPDRGDIIWVELGPVMGHEQTGHRPALVLSTKKYNDKSSRLVLCPLTTRLSRYPFEVPIVYEGTSGAVLVDHIHNIDWRSRHATPGGQIDEPTLQSVLQKLKLFLQLP